MKRGMTLADNGIYSCCVQEIESSEHLFVHCTIAWGLWCEVIRMEGILWVVPKSLVDLAEQWDFLCLASDPQLWRLIPYSMVWYL